MATNENEITARRLQLALSNAGMKAQELADRSGVSKASISQYVNGSHSPSNLSAEKMAAVLGVDPLWLMGFDIPMDGAPKKQEYYLDPDAAKVAQEIYEDPNLHALFDAARDSRPEDLRTVADWLRRLKGGGVSDE